MHTHDVAVIGLGAMGSATAYHLSTVPGLRVIGLDRFRPPHPHGSSHGDTRATRCAPFEGDELVAMVRRSLELYADLADRSGRTLHRRTGGLIIGRPGQPGYHGVDQPFRRTVEAAVRHGVEHEVLAPEDVAERFPQVRLAEDEEAYYEPDGGVLYAEECVRAHIDAARANGAEIHVDELVLDWRPVVGGVRVTTAKGVYDVGTLVIAAGPWVGRLLPEMASLFEVQRLAVFWFALTDAHRYADHAAGPRIGWAYGAGAYAFPALDGPNGGVKVATEEHTVVVRPEQVHRGVLTTEAAHVYESVVRDRLNGVGPGVVRAETCLYTMTPDSRFVIDRHPEHDRVVIASPCSGHGFKHSAAVGEAVAQLATDTQPRLDLAPFRVDRFATVAAAQGRGA